MKLQPPQGRELPEKGFERGDEGYVAPASDGTKVNIVVDPASKRLQLLEPFRPWDSKEFAKMRVLAKVEGKCTTDHISPAGKWLLYRGHLDNISENMLTGARNAFREEIGKGKNLFTGEIESYPALARDYKKRGVNWVVIGDKNYGEGSSREHAAMEPRHLGGGAIVVKKLCQDPRDQSKETRSVSPDVCESRGL